MGLIKAAAGAIGGTMADQWLDYFYCEALDKDVLMAKGQKRASDRSSNKKGEDNVRHSDTVYAVNLYILLSKKPAHFVNCRARRGSVG